MSRTNGQLIINYHTSGTSLPTASNVELGEVVVLHNPSKVELVVKDNDGALHEFVESASVISIAQEVLSKSGQTYSADETTITKGEGNVFSAIVDQAGGLVSYDSYNTFSGNVITTLKYHNDVLSGVTNAVGEVVRLIDGAVTSAATYSDAQLGAYSATVETALSGKADKVAGATAGNFAGLDANGNLTDSGKKASDFVEAEDGKRLMTDEEGTKLAGIEEGAEVNIIETVKVNGTALTVTDKAVDITIPAEKQYKIVTATTTEGALKSYKLVADDQDITGSVTIDLAKDLVVTSGRVVKNPEGQPAGTYLELTIANQEDKVYINVADLAHAYTADEETIELSDTNVFSVKDGVFALSAHTHKETEVTLATPLVYSGVTIAAADKNMHEALDAVISQMVDNEKVTAAALNDLNGSITTLQTDVAQAQADASQAKTDAAAAKTDAASALTAAASAKADAASAMTAAAAAKADAASALTAASEAKADAASAMTAASEAKTAADSAITAADKALEDAASALTAADTALEEAAKAITSITVNGTAVTVTDQVAALASVVTSVEDTVSINLTLGTDGKLKADVLRVDGGEF